METGAYTAALIALCFVAMVFAWAVIKSRAKAGPVPLTATISFGVLGVFMIASSGQVFYGARILAYMLFLLLPVFYVGSAFILWEREKGWARFYLVGALLVAIIGVDGFLIEPKWLEISRIEISDKRVIRPLRISLIADIQTGEIGDYQRRVLGEVMKGKPDLILFAGDYIQVDDMTDISRPKGDFNRLLREIGLNAPLGVFAVKGNIDGSNWKDMFKGLDIKCIDDTRSFDVGGIRLTCLSDEDSWKTLLMMKGTEKYHVVLGHVPNFALRTTEGDLLLAGHTHGGQVQIPFIGPLVTLSAVPRKMASGLTELGNGRKLVVSRGIGLEGYGAPKFRFLCRPQLIFINLKPQ